MDTREIDELEGSIAIIGMSGRLPGAKNIEEFWHNLKNGVESVTFFSDEELIASGIDPAILKDKSYVKAKGVLDNIAEFDATFFGLSPKEAQLIDPQHRLFLECAWEALEHAGYDPKTYSGSIGVYGGVGSEDTYLLKNLYINYLNQNVEQSQMTLGNEKDFLCNRVSYKLNLNGPSITVQTACSTSLVAVVTGYQSLLDYQCDIALAGGAAISLPQKAGYFYREGMILSPDGHCRAFDAKAQGTVSGNGVGIVVLKRLEDALAEGDQIYAIIRGAAINNDGALKAGFTAPSLEAQARLIAEALSLAETPAETMSYVEAHGTGTPLGDPIEIAALSQAFATERTGYCALGSVKTNIGHLDAAAGVAGLIKTVLALKHQLLPASLHFEQPNPKIDFANCPFYVNTKLSAWKTQGFPRRAGVSSFGMGGTNAHVILEEAPKIPKKPKTSKIRPNLLLLLSAKTDTALETATTQFVEHLKQHPHLNLADVAYTYQVGRCAFSQRRMLVCQTLEEAVNALETREAQRVFNHVLQTDEEPAVVFMFSGQGAQYVNMGLELYQTEPLFREQVEQCAKFLEPHLGLDLRRVLYPALQIPPNPLLKKEGQGDLTQTAMTQPALFVIEYALAQLWMSWGVQPKAMIGHSLGEYVAACLAGVFSLEEALVLLAARGRLMQSVPVGAMLAVPLSEDEIRPLLNIDTELAAVNIPTQCVVSGTSTAVEQLATQLAEQGVVCKRVSACDAFHSKLMSPILTPLLEQLQQIQLKPPQIPFLSNVTGTWIRAEEATNPHYWVKHARQTVHFASELQQVLQQPQHILLEVGPGRTLTTFAKRHPDNNGQLVLSSLAHSKSEHSESAFLLNTLGKLWMAGVTVNWSAFYADEQRYRLPLPTYPFERQRYWIKAPKIVTDSEPFQHQVTITSQLWESLVEAGHKQAQQDIATFDNPAYVEKYQWLNRLCAAYVNLALQELGAFSNPAEQYSDEKLLRQFQILPFYRQMFPRGLTALVEQGQLQQQGDKFTLFLPLSRDYFKALEKEVRSRWTKTPEWLELVQLCGEKLAAILTGKANPRELIFTGPAFATLQNLYKNSPESRYFDTLVQTSLRQLVKSLPPTTNLRILEIGAGTGATTTYLLPELPPQRTHYVFTDISHSFLSQARQKFSEYPYIEYRLLDIEQNPNKQGYENQSFNVVIAAQVLHATKNLGKTLEHVCSLLAPEGFLLLWEATQKDALYFDVAFPLMQPFDDDDELRSQHSFLTTEQWYEALRRYGFVDVEYFPKTEVLSDHFFIAQAVALPTSSQGVALPTSLSKLEKANLLHSRRTVSNAYVPPRNEKEQIIAYIWQNFFSLESVGIEDDFFELGGDSLMAVQLISELRRTLSVELSVHSLLEKPTIAALVESIQLTPTYETQVTPEQTLPPLLVEIQPGNDQRQPLFLVHPAGGHVYFYRDLAYHLGADQPVYGVQAPEVEGNTQPLTKIEEMATVYLKALRVVQPEGPYFIGGASFGGLVAFEMAQQLHALSQKVALLTMIDTPSLGQIMPKLLKNDVDILAYLLNVSDNMAISSEEFQQLSSDEQLKYFLAHGKRVHKLFPETTINQLRHFLHIFKLNLQAIFSYRPSHYFGKILFFRATEQDEFNPQNPEHGWFELAAGGVEVYEIPGNHITMNYPPHVEVMAEILKTYLDKV
jgi:acyl transferase domain-containing protein/thioesterase domain-containing protein/ubiquinone/menaquinone biosynthesis C-methylase UbiE/acyl carrier protein